MANLSNTELDANAIKEEARAVDTTKKLKIGIILSLIHISFFVCI